MPTNVTPEYKRAKEAFKAARDPAERLSCLKEMLRTIPKHKGTEHLQADIKTRIKNLSDELTGPKKGGSRTGPITTVQPEGAAQIALIGPPNSGKSSLHATLTGSHAEAGPYPYTTHLPLPGMMRYQDIHFQLVDLPPISTDSMEPWLPNAVQPAGAALLVVDLGLPGCVENVAAIRERLEQKRITLTDDWKGRLSGGFIDTDPDFAAPPAGAAAAPDDSDDDLDDPFRLYLPTLLVATKSDLNMDMDEIGILEDLVGVLYPAVAVSTKTGSNLEMIGKLLFHGLGIVRVYTKIPGRPADMGTPYTVPAGGTVLDVARLVHRELAASLKYARIWGSSKFDGQQVGRDHLVGDGDVLELHT
jgi:ribosome-interacting GTPase 1